MMPEIQNLNPRIRQMLGEERVRMADLERAFGEDPLELMQDVGLHPNAQGLRIIAEVFARLVD